VVDVTVAVPTHNRAATVVMAVKTALNQSRPPRRVLVLADGCTDDTVDACRAIGDPRVEALDLPKEPGYGYLHRNIPHEEAGENEVVAWLGDDDLWMPDHLERVGELFDVDEADIVTAMSALIEPDGGMTATGYDFRVPWLLDRYFAGEQRTPTTAIAVRPAAAARVGGWRREPTVGGDYDLWKRVLGSGARPGYVHVPTVVYPKSRFRDQSWEDHVAQNAAFLDQILDPVQVVRLRHRLVLSVSRRDADMERDRRQLDEWVTQLNRDLQAAQAECEEARRERDELARRSPASSVIRRVARRFRWGVNEGKSGSGTV
jgi:glycosyltransferase involved in cell wall biosynthesis